MAIIGAGILGLTTARALLDRRPDRRIVVIEKEPAVARHQTGRNSGVIHSGIYYKPDSGKATMVAAGRRALFEFLDSHGIAYDMCGKVVVAVDEAERTRLDALEQRAAENDVATERLDRHALREREPHIEGVAALLVPSAGIVDYGAVCAALVTDLTAAGAEIRLGTRVTGLEVAPDRIGIETSRGDLTAGSIVNCGGLHCDRVATAAGADTGGVRVMPFRGEYFELAPHARGLVNHLVYPLPDPDFPFLGVHLTRMIDGSIHAGPSAVPAMARGLPVARHLATRQRGDRVLATHLGAGPQVLAQGGGRDPSLPEQGRVPEGPPTAVSRAHRRRPRAVGIGRPGPGDRPTGPCSTTSPSPTVPAPSTCSTPSPAATASFAIATTVADRHDRLDL
ncbi:MAG: L-2-hydroxyglutarate oxidase [Acidimicrobiales bacterium]